MKSLFAGIVRLLTRVKFPSPRTRPPEEAEPDMRNARAAHDAALKSRDRVLVEFRSIEERVAKK